MQTAYAPCEDTQCITDLLRQCISPPDIYDDADDIITALQIFMADNAYDVQRRCVCVPLRICYPETAQHREELLAEGIPEGWLRECNPCFYQESLAPLKSCLLTWMVHGARMYYSKRLIHIPQSLQKEVINKQRNIVELIKDFVGSNLRCREGFRLPLPWLYEIFLQEHEEVSKSELTAQAFNSTCCKEVVSAFSGSSKNTKARWTGKDKVSTTGICVMGVFWTDTKQRELGEHHVYVRENDKYLEGFTKPM